MTAETFLNGRVTLHKGDCLDVLAAMPEASVDSVVCDPPYHLTDKRIFNMRNMEANGDGSNRTEQANYKAGGFMGQRWDGGDIAFRPETWAAVLRVLKPGGHLFAFSGTRTQHRMVCAIEDAGFEIRDQIGWAFGSGFPKSHDVSKGIARRAGGALVARQAIEFMRHRREELGLSRIEFERVVFGRSDGNVRNWEDGISLPQPGLWPKIKQAMGLMETPFDSAMERGDEEVARGGGDFGYQNGERWAKERIIRSPAIPAARQWEGWGTALKPAWEPICVARKPLSEGTVAANVLRHGTGALNIDGCRVESEGGKPRVGETSQERRYTANGSTNFAAIPGPRGGDPAGRWPANLIHDGSDEVLALFPETSSGLLKAGTRPKGARSIYGQDAVAGYETLRDAGGDSGSAARFFYCAKADGNDRIGSKHPTVKPLDLMQYLVRLVTPPGGTVLDPFAGTGTTGEAAWREGFNAILIEREPEYQADIARRMALCLAGTEGKDRAILKTKPHVDAGPLFGGGTA